MSDEIDACELAAEIVERFRQLGPMPPGEYFLIAPNEEVAAAWREADCPYPVYVSDHYPRGAIGCR